MTTDRQDDSRNPEERLLALFLEAHPKAEAVAFETWVASRAELRDDAQLVHRLRALFAQWHRAAELLGDGLSSRRSNLGSFFRAAGKDRGANDERSKSAGLQVGQRVGHFTLRSFIAQGGMGQVWQAHDEDLRTDVALKLILPGRIDAHSLDLFAREARAGGRLRHPYIVSTLSTGRADGLTWIAQELVDGSWTLKDYLDQLRTEDTVPKDHYKSVALFVARVADGLQAAHDAGVIHRDVKPANILIAPDDTPRLTDFGLARVVDDSFLSQSGDLAGTWSYMSPEQVTAKRMGLDHRTDVFSLGVVLYELLTLRRPFEGDTTHQIAAQIITHEPPQASKIRSQCPRELAIICGKALEKAPTRRYATMREFSADLHRHLNHEPIVARRPGPVVRAVKWGQRHPAGAVALIALSLVFSLLVVGGLYVQQQWLLAEDARASEYSARVEAQASEEKAVLEEHRARAAAETARRSAYALRIKAANDAIADGTLSKAQRILRDCPEDLRGWEWAHLRLQSDSSCRVLRQPGKYIGKVAWSPDGSQLISSTLDGLVSSWDVELRERLDLWDERMLPKVKGDSLGSKFLTKSGQPSRWAIAPSGACVAIATGDHTIVLASLSGAAVTQVLRGHAKDITGVSWSPDGSRIASSSRDGSVRIWSAQSGDCLQVLDQAGESVLGVSWSPNDAALACVAGGYVYVWSATNFESRRILAGQGDVRGVSWSPDGGRLAIRDSSAVILCGLDAEEQIVLSGHKSSVYTCAWSPNGQLLATGSDDNTVRVWNAVTGEQFAVFDKHQGVVRVVAWSPDGSRLASSSYDHTVRIWDVPSRAELYVFRGHEADVCEVAWDPSGEFVASSSLDSTVRVWNANGRSASSTLAGGERDVYDVEWATGGAQLEVYSSSQGDSLRSLADGKLVGRARARHVLNQREMVSPDGSLLAQDRGDRGFCVLRVSDRTEVATYGDLEGRIGDVAWSPSGKEVAAADRRGNVYLLDVLGNAMPRLLAAPEFENVEVTPSMLSGPRHATPYSPSVLFEPELAWSPDGVHVATKVDFLTIRIWDTAAGSVQSTLRGHADSVRHFAWNPDGSRLASTSRDSTLRIWDTSSGNELLAIDLSPWNHVAPKWSSDGLTLIVGGLVLHSDAKRAADWSREADLQRRALALVEPLFAKWGLLDDVLDALGMSSGVLPEVQERAEQFAKVHGDCSAAELNSLARVLVTPELELGREVERGLRLAQKAVELEPKDSSIRMTLAWALFINGRCEEALSAARMALRLAWRKERELVEADVLRLRMNINTSDACKE